MPGEFEDDDDVEVEEVEQESKGLSEEKLAEMLESRLGPVVKQNQELSVMAADPDVRALLEAKAQGKKLKLVAAEEEAELPEDFDTLNGKEMLELIEKRTEQRIAAVLDKTFNEKLAPVLEGLTSFKKNSEAEKINQSIQAARKKFDDFDHYRKDMAQLTDHAPGLTVEELYLVAKQRKGAVSKRVETERPTNTTRVPSGTRRKPKLNHQTGKSAFAQALSSALDTDDDEYEG